MAGHRGRSLLWLVLTPHPRHDVGVDAVVGQRVGELPQVFGVGGVGHQVVDVSALVVRRYSPARRAAVSMATVVSRAATTPRGVVGSSAQACRILRPTRALIHTSSVIELAK